MVSANTHPSLIRSDVIHPIRVGAPEFLVDEVVNLDFDGLTVNGVVNAPDFED